MTYETDVVRSACSPSGIPKANPKYLPTIGEIEIWLAKRASEVARANHYSKMLPMRYDAPKYPRWNLFVPASATGYGVLMDRLAQAEEGKDYKFESYGCSDGQIRPGVWVPLQWWDEIRCR